MRPRSIALFEMLFWAGAAASFLGILLNYGALRNFAISRGGAAASPLLGLIIGVAINLLFWFFIVRRPRNLAKWLFCLCEVFAVIGLPESLTKASRIGTGYAATLLLAFVLQSIALLLLFRKDARLWLRHKGRMPASVSDVFG